MASFFVKKAVKQFRSNLITGILLIIPFFVSVLIIIQLFQWIDSALPGVIGVKLPPGLGVLITIVIAYFAGLIAKNYFGKKLISVGNAVFLNIPVFKTIYQTVQQIVDVVSLNNKQLFKKAVLVEFPRKNSYAVGFITSESNTDFSLKIGEKLIGVFIPTTPNPTSGFLLYVPETDVIDCNIPMDFALKLIMSGGLLSPDQAAKAMAPKPPPAKGWKWTDIFTRKRPGSNVVDPRD
jgi:uncharacterized membrane protein